jgi:hypothetical protein
MKIPECFLAMSSLIDMNLMELVIQESFGIKQAINL